MFEEPGCSQQDDDRLVLSGTVEAREIVLAFQVGGRIDELLVDEGEAVTKGQPVARLVCDDYQQLVDRARAEMGVAEATLAGLLAGTREQELQVAETNVPQATADGLP